MPLGSYAPEFKLRQLDVLQPQLPLDADPSASLESSPKEKRLPGTLTVVLAVIAIAAVLFAGYTYIRNESPNKQLTARFWAPLLKSSSQILMVAGTSHPDKMVPETESTSFFDHMTGPYHHVSIAIAVAMANLAGLLRENGTTYEVKEDTETSLTDIRARPMILVGALNNAWTMRLVSHLRYRFVNGPTAAIIDTRNPQNSNWTVDFSRPYASVGSDYAIVARFRDPTTEAPVMIIAGLGPYATEAASEFVVTPQYLSQIGKQLPAGWENGNIELVIKTDVIGSKAGPPVLVATTTW